MTRRFMTAFAAGLLAYLPLVHSASAAVYVSDGFDDGGYTNGTDPLDASWAPNYGAYPLSIKPFNSTGNTSNSLYFNPAGATYYNAIGSYTGSQSLSKGDSITLSFDFRVIYSGAGTQMRFGLGSSSDSFEYVFGINGTAIGQIGNFGPNATSGTSTNLTTSGTAFSLASTDTTPHNFTLTLTRSDTNTLNLSGSLDGAHVLAGTRTGLSNFLFDRVLIGQGNSATSLNIDKVVVATPEPTTLAAIGLLGMLTLQRRTRLARGRK